MRWNSKQQLLTYDLVYVNKLTVKDRKSQVFLLKLNGRKRLVSFRGYVFDSEDTADRQLNGLQAAVAF